jgi:ACS family D-galactonate transporter-like MFS transporter
MMAIFVFLLVGACSSVILLQRKWAPRVAEAPAAPEAPHGEALSRP